jgi:acetoin utilization deacetylase AcuC-like enzyme
VTESPPTPRLAIATGDRFAAHVAPGFHPERPERLAAARRALEGLPGTRVAVALRPATRDELLRVHDPGYLATLERELARGTGYLDGDTYFGPGTHEAAWLAAGGACEVVDALIQDRADVGALLARPPGHHATRSRAMGFCLLNNVAVAAAHARARGLDRVAIVDWDVHHGNGTEDIFQHDPSVLVVSLHQWPLYPGTGAAHDVGQGDARGTTVNIPLPPDSGGAVYRAAFDRLVLPLLAEARPDLVLVSAGFDAHERDPLAAMRLHEADYAWMASRLREAALALGHGRVVLFLEGGYDLRALEASLAASLRALVHPVPREAERGGPLPEDAERALRAAVEAQRPFWRSLA